MKKAVITAIAGGALALAPLSVAGASPRSSYLSLVHHLAPATKKYSNANIVKLGHVICADLNAGTSVNSEVITLVEANDSHHIVSNRGLGVILGAAVNYFCPSFDYALTTWVNAEQGKG